MTVSDRPSARSEAAERFGLTPEQLEGELDHLDIDQSMAGARGVVIPYTIMLGALLALMLPFSPTAACVLWALSFGIYILARRQMNRHYAAWSVEERKAHRHAWHRTMIVSTAVFGALWGSAGMIAFPGSPLEVKLLWTLAHVMLVAGAPRLLTLPQFVALVVGLQAFGTTPWLLWGGWLGIPMAIALVLLAGLFTVMTRHFHLGLRQKFELQLHNEHLVRELARQNLVLQQMAGDRTQLLAAASHDLRQPVHALGLLMDVLQRTKDAAALRRRLSMASDCVETLSEMLTNLLDFTRAVSNSLPVNTCVTSLQETLDDVSRIFDPFARGKGLSLKVTHCALSVRTDPHLLRRMLFNLVSNALKYTRKGTVHLWVEVTAGQVVLHVEDSGVGIAPDRVAGVFEDYVTSDLHAASFDGGIGLGLGIVRRCAALLGHELSVRSTPGTGSRFSIRLGLPVDPLHEPPASESQRLRLPGVVAIIENDATILEGLGEMLRDWGCHTVAGATAEQVRQQLDEQHLMPQLIVSDLHLGMATNGFDAIALLRLGTLMGDVPAMVLTGDLSPSHLLRAKAQHVRLEHKPLRPARLRTVMAEMLETLADGPISRPLPP